MRQARHLPQRWYWSIVLQVRDVIRQFTQGTPNCNTNPKAIVFGIPKEPVLESAELITSRLTGAGSLPASRLRRSMGQRARNRNPRLHFPPVRVAAHGKHAGQTQKPVLTIRKKCTLLPPTILFHTTLGSRLYMRVLARALSPSSIFIMPKKINSFSQTPSSTPRRHSCGSPIAHRLRSRIATEQAVQQSILSRLNACEITSQQCRPLPTGGTYQHSKYVPTPSQHQASPFLSTPSTQEKIQRESSTPKAVTPPRQTSAPPSPSVLDIVLRGDISLPPSPEVAELEAT
ncbi:hypothetical protein TNCV_2164051 [Trichonephila clavipes]|nr:hypothetical protein TNCV_2164051 [Trichonephila clavipes]